MTTVEISMITIAGLSIIALVVFFLMVSPGWSSGAQPLAKIRVRSNDHMNRPPSSADENNDVIRIPNWLLGLFVFIIVITTVLAASSHP